MKTKKIKSTPSLCECGNKGKECLLFVGRRIRHMVICDRCLEYEIKISGKN